MLKIPKKYEQKYFAKRNSPFLSLVPPALLLDYSAGGVTGELW
jgi:hypothetical protein